MTAGEVKVLSIIGMTRSGSTLLDNLLGELDNFFSTGELHYLWSRGLVDGRHCGCGSPVTECVLWSQVMDLASKELGLSGLNPFEIGRWQHREVRVRHTRRLLRKNPTGNALGDLESYVNVLGALYRSLSQVTGARVLVDSSKRPSDAAVLRLVHDVTPYFVHLVRDPRAVTYSWRRRKPELDQGGATEMPRHGPWHSSSRWLGLNLTAEIVTKSLPRGHFICLRYEDFISHPRETITTLARFVGEEPTSLDFLSDGGAILGDNHSVAGNPSRFARGYIRLQEDDEWRRLQPKSDRLLTSALTLPLLGRYGYRFHEAASKKGASQDGAPGEQA